MEKLSAIIIVYNEEKNIKECLESINWVDEIIIVDSFSQDKTVKICQQFTNKIFQRQWPGYAAQKQFALDHATYRWVLSIDADERVTNELQQEIRNVLKSNNSIYDGYYIPRLSTFLGKEIYHSGWRPGYQLRLFRKQKTKLSHWRVHEGFLVNGKCGYLQSNLLHITHATLEESLSRMNRYSSLQALDRFENKRKGKIRWYHFFIHPLAVFGRQFFLKKGFLDGIHGLILAMVSAMVKLALYLKLWELQNKSIVKDGSK